MLAMTTMGNLAMILPANQIPGPRQGTWTYADYATLPHDGRRYEIMDGVLLMSPSPSPAHQSITGWIFYYLNQQIGITGLGRVFTAPLDVELAPNRVVQPDVLVLLNKHLDRLTTSRIVGPPDLVVEVSSPGTAAYDRLKKLDAYAQAGVEEYWIADPELQTIEVLSLHAGLYLSAGVFSDTNILPSVIVLGIQSTHVAQFFA